MIDENDRNVLVLVWHAFDALQGFLLIFNRLVTVAGLERKKRDFGAD